MSAALLHLGTLLLAVVLAGLARRGRVTRLLSWSGYLAVLLAWQLFVTFRPSGFTWPAFAAKDLAATGLTLAVLLEIAARVFGRLPGARRRVAASLLVVLVGAALYAWEWTAAPEQSWARYAALVAVPRVNVGLSVAFAVLLLWTIRYGVPLDHVHKSVLAGLTAFLLSYAVTSDQLHLVGPVAREAAGLAFSLLYLVVLGAWARVAWIPGEIFSAFAEVETGFWPWAPASSHRS